MKLLTHITTSLFIALMVLFLSPLLGITDTDNAFAQDSDDPYQFLAPIGGLGDADPTDEDPDRRLLDMSSEDSFPQYIQTMITIVIGFAIMAAILLIIGAGFQYMTSVSESGKSAAKERISRSIMGLVLALASVVILQTVNPDLIELNSVETVTTTGSSFAGVDPMPTRQFNGSVHIPEKNTHGNKYCMFVRGEINTSDIFGLDSQNDRYICYETKNKCLEGKEWARDAGETGSWWTELECKFYYESRGELVQIGEINEDGDVEPLGEEVVLTDDVVGVSADGKNQAINECEDNSDKVVNLHNMSKPANYPECVNTDQYTRSWNGACEIRCEEPVGEPASIPDSWTSHEWCSVNDPTADSSNCWEERSTCNSASGGECYAHPTVMYGNKSTSCEDCMFVDELTRVIIEDEGGSYSEVQNKVFKYNNMCSGNNASFCRINDDLIGKLYSLYKTGPEFEITEVFPPAIEHRNNCHYNGTCVDIGVRPEGLRDNENYEEKVLYLNSFITAAKEAEVIGDQGNIGLTACYEVGDEEEEVRILNKIDDFESSGYEIDIDHTDILVVEDIVDHFSVYENRTEICDTRDPREQ